MRRIDGLARVQLFVCVLHKQAEGDGRTNFQLPKLVKLLPFSSHLIHRHVIVFLSYIPPLSPPRMKLWILGLYLIYASRENTSLNLLALG